MLDLHSSEISSLEIASSEEVSISGKVIKIIYNKPEDDFFIFTMQMAGTKNDVKVKGYCFDLLPGMEMDCSGIWEKNPKFGDTLNATNITEFIPTTAEGIRKLLHNGFVKDISIANANDLINWFGHKLFDVAEFKSERLREVPGVSANRINNLVNTVKEKRAVPRIMNYLAEIGLTRGLAHRVYKELGPDAISLIRKNPYCLIRVPRVRFADADGVAKALGIEAYAEPRISAAMDAVLIKEGEQGSTAMLRGRLLDGIMKIISSDEASIYKIEAVLDLELAKQTRALIRIIKGVEYVSSREQYLAELRIARGIMGIQKAKNAKRVSSTAMSSTRFAHLVKDQISAARIALESNISIITGRPGCGKTTVTKSIVEVLMDTGMSVLLCAPTGQAAKRIKEATGYAGVTIHRALGSRGANGFEHNEGNPLPYDCVLIDEASMIGTYLMDKLISAISPGTKVILVGDPDQLASIDPGNVLLDLINSGVVDVCTLTEPHRFAKGSSIVTNSHLINDGKVPIKNDQGDFRMYETRNDEDLITSIIEQYTALRKEGFGGDDIQILTPMRRVTNLGANNLNKILKDYINPVGKDPSITKGKFDHQVTFSINDRVMQCSNNKDLGIFNGDIGNIVKIEKGIVTVDFSGDLVSLQRSDLDDLELAYASTIHKSQGSEHKAVIIPICKSHGGMMDRSLLYTGSTRGKMRVALIGDLWMLKHIVEKISNKKRITGLEQCLCDEFDMLAASSKNRYVIPNDSSYSLN